LDLILSKISSYGRAQRSQTIVVVVVDLNDNKFLVTLFPYSHFKHFKSGMFIRFKYDYRIDLLDYVRKQ